jgi:NADH:ubiquinone oxidoreductase subunit 2 (subunit N)
MLALLSLAGVPPLVGFVGKFLLLMVIMASNNYLMFIVIVSVNLFMLYFYIQNIRFVISKNNTTVNYIKNHSVYLDFKLINIVSFVNILNIFKK